MLASVRTRQMGILISNFVSCVRRNVSKLNYLMSACVRLRCIIWQELFKLCVISIAVVGRQAYFVYPKVCYCFICSYFIWMVIIVSAYLYS